MPSKKPQFNIRADKELFYKLDYIAKTNERSRTQEIIYVLKNHVKTYEQYNGEIKTGED